MAGNIFGLGYIDFIMFLLFGLFIGYIWYIEHKDIHCPTLNSSKEECDNGGGMAFSNTKPNDDDTCQNLLNKIYKAAGAEQSSVKWRKAMILSTGIMVVFWLLSGPFIRDNFSKNSTLPSWQLFYISVLIGYCVLLGSYLYYSYHVFGVAEKWIKDSVKEMEKKGCIKN